MIVHYLFYQLILSLKSFVLGMSKPKHWLLLLSWYHSLWRTRHVDFESQLLVNSGRYEVNELNYVRTPLCSAYGMLAYAGVNSKSVVVDLGAGTGSFIIAALLNEASHVCGVELQGALIAGLKSAFSKDEKMSFIKGDASQVSLPVGTHYVVGWTTWRQEARKLLEEKLNLLPAGTCVWTFTHELSGVDWQLKSRQNKTFPGFRLEVFLYEKG